MDNPLVIPHFLIFGEGYKFADITFIDISDEINFQCSNSLVSKDGILMISGFSQLLLLNGLILRGD